MRPTSSLFLLQLSLLSILSFRPLSILRYETLLNARRPTPDGGLLSYQSSEKEEIDNRPNFIHRAQVADNHPQKLLEFVYTVFPDVKRTQAKQWLQYNSLLVNDEPQTKFDLALRIGDWISVKAGKSRGGSRSAPGNEKKKSFGVLPFGLKIIFEDAALFIVDKPHGMSVSSSQQSSSTPSTNEKFSKGSPVNSGNSTGSTERTNAVKKSNPIISNTKTVHSVVSSYLGKRAGSSESKVFIVNRLDEEESGLVIFAKSAAYKEYLYKNWNSFGVVYNVICEGLLFPQQGTIKTYMDESASTVTCSLNKLNTTTTKSALPAISHYRTLESVSSLTPLMFGDKKSLRSGQSEKNSNEGSFSLLEISLETTKRDQVRAQFAYMNKSICGDYKYGPLATTVSTSSTLVENSQLIEEVQPVSVSKDSKDSVKLVDSEVMSIHDPIRRLAVHFTEIRMTHPLTKDAVTISCSYPASFNDLIRRSQSESSSTLFELGEPYSSSGGSSVGSSSSSSGSNYVTSGSADSSDMNGEDGQLDSLRIGSEKHIASSNSNDKVKVFTLTEFLGSPVKTRSNSRSNSNAPPPDTSNNFAKKKSKR